MRKFKNCFIFIFLLFLLIGCTETTQNHVHTYENDFECIDKICTECGEILHATKNHKSDAQYPCQAGKCLDCGLEIDAKAQHQYDKTYNCCDNTCTVCGYVRYATENHKLYDHHPCEDSMCMICDEVFEAKFEHDFDHNYNCLDKTCKDCGLVEKASKGHNNSSEHECVDGVCLECGIELPATKAHDFDSSTDPDNTTCVECGYTQEVVCEHEFDHNYNCLDKKCIHCEYVEKASRDHNNSSEHECVDGVCLECGTQLPATKAHDFDNNHDCLDKTCKDCGLVEKASKEHSNSSEHECVDGVCLECGTQLPATKAHDFVDNMCECGLEKYLVNIYDLQGELIESYYVLNGEIVELPVLDVSLDVKYGWIIDGEYVLDSFVYEYNCGVNIYSIIIPDSYTYNTYTSACPTNWNELTYIDNNDTQIMKYIGSSFFNFDFKFDANGEIIPGEFEVEYSAATKLEDVTAEYVGEEWGIPEGAQHRAYVITLREDLKWDDGTPINASDFVYTMQEQLNPLFKHYRAESFYVGNTIIHNAENYVKQGSYLPNVDNSESGVYTLENIVKGEDGVYTQPNGERIFFDLDAASAWGSGYSVVQLVRMGYLDSAAFQALSGMADENYEIDVTDETIELYAKLINTPAWGNEPRTYVPYYFYYEITYREISFDQVGIFVGDTPYELVLVLDKPLQLLKEDGSLDYKAAYYMSSLPLVHRAKYEANKVEPSGANALWTSQYNSSVGTTASWGPYKLTSFQAGKSYVLERNNNWFGYNMDAYEGQYQTDKIECEVISEWNTAWLKFRAGEVDEIYIDVSIADEYKGSERAYFTPDDYVGSLQLQSSKDALEAREREGVNKTLLTYKDFRQALSLAINRDEYNKKCTTASLAGYGLFNSMHYYDIANGKAYRNEDVAKQVLCDVYGVDVSKYPSLDAAYEAITGYNLTLARQLVDKAYDQALADGEIGPNDVVELQFGSFTINPLVTRNHNFIKESWLELVKGTKLEGRLQFADDKEAGSAWANDFRNGTYDVCMGGWTGATWDPGYFLLAYLSPDYMYSTAWDTSSHMLEFTMPGVGENGADVTDTLSLMDWYDCLNGNAGCVYNWAEGVIPNSKRLLLIAALEKEVLGMYYSVPIQYSFSASLLSYKVEFITYEYNSFMHFGDIRYMTYNYNDIEWQAIIDENNGSLEYR